MSDTITILKHTSACYTPQLWCYGLVVLFDTYIIAPWQDKLLQYPGVTQGTHFDLAQKKTRGAYSSLAAPRKEPQKNDTRKEPQKN